MNSKKGTNNQDIKRQNKLLILKMIATGSGLSRVDIAHKTGLTKMTVGNLIAELIEENLISESEHTSGSETENKYGRKPITFSISDRSPCTLGILIKRELCQLIIGDLSGTILDSIKYTYESMNSASELLELLYEGYRQLQARTHRRIIYIGISSVGPIDTQKGIILNPPFFYGIQDLPITSFFKEKTGLPTYLINDANAGALAEKLYGKMTNVKNYLYLHIMNGIGTGIIINDLLYEGNTGQSGEFGHISINYAGPKCDCGNQGCLELYANIKTMRNSIIEHQSLFPDSPLLKINKPNWENIVSEANRKDPLAEMVLANYCSYIAYALVNMLKILDVSTIITGYTNPGNGDFIERLLQVKLSRALRHRNFGDIIVRHSSFDDNAPLIGSIAFINNKIFNGELPL